MASAHVSGGLSTASASTGVVSLALLPILTLLPLTATLLGLPPGGAAAG
jgi:hypothetical protein